MNETNKKKRTFGQTLLVAAILSILLHQLMLTGLTRVFDLSPEKPAERHEVELLPPPPEAPKPEAPKPEALRKAIPVPKRAPSPQPVKTVERPTPMMPMAPPMPGAATGGETAVPDGIGSESEGPIASGPAPDPNARPTPPKLNMGWRSFEKAFGAKVDVDRESYVQESLEKRRGYRAFGNNSARVARALANNRSFIKPGTQEVLGPRKQLFHNYIEAIHEAAIHPIFADQFLRSLPALAPSDPLNNPELNMVAEFEIFESGAISEIRVMRTSGNTVFDAGAVDAIYRSSPFPPPPKEVLSWNRRVYLRWGFYRNNRKCGVFNVEPYILRAPDGKEEALPVDKFTVTDG